MAIKVWELTESREFTLARPGGNTGRDLVFRVTGTTDEEDVRKYILGDPGNPPSVPPIPAKAPAVYLHRVIDTVACKHLGNGVWDARVSYSRFDNKEFTFSTGGGTIKMTQSLQTISSHAPPGMTPPNFRGAIGVNGDRIEGVEVGARQFKFTETYEFNDAQITTAYKQALFLLTGTYNAATFRFFAAGECFLDGVNGSKRGDELWALTFSFIGSPNVTGLTVGDITGIDKLGHDYLWVCYADYEDAFAYHIVKKPIAAYVERVIDPGDWSLLGIGS